LDVIYLWELFVSGRLSALLFFFWAGVGLFCCLSLLFWLRVVRVDVSVFFDVVSRQVDQRERSVKFHLFYFSVGQSFRL